ncbi:MAG: NAD(P)-dependent oxidoreductase [Burkholderiales bacterium]|nr:NAD(P)-dependent oxidoreductase [Burkholderiales bacterium]MBH2015747.1 NAD(P)-dependent oxidoreductase [Burkholderiales bacterium]
MATLSGKTLFISGASRGIGLAIALRAARDGANVVIAAKTAEPDPRLPGTIHTAAAEVEAAGGRALALQVDIRDEDAVQAAVARAAEHFGGIDILVNNASAIGLTRTPDTPLKRYDLMMDINVRGSFVCAQACLPHLQRAANPHILSLSPPLNLDPKWLGVHAAYTTSKYAMSLIALGLAEELKAQGIAVNTLWPQTIIATSALNVASVGLGEMGRKPEVMADAAWHVLTADARSLTGRSLVDEAVLRQVGVTDFSGYLVKPGVTPIIDLFLDPAEGPVSEAALRAAAALAPHPTR